MWLAEKCLFRELPEVVVAVFVEIAQDLCECLVVEVAVILGVVLLALSQVRVDHIVITIALVDEQTEIGVPMMPLVV